MIAIIELHCHLGKLFEAETRVIGGCLAPIGPQFWFLVGALLLMLPYNNQASGSIIDPKQSLTLKQDGWWIQGSEFSPSEITFM